MAPGSEGGIQLSDAINEIEKTWQIEFIERVGKSFIMTQKRSCVLNLACYRPE